MNEPVSGRVRIGTCSDMIDVGFIRSAFDARGIALSIGAEHHATLLGPLYGAFLSLDIWVAEEDAEEAAALLQDLREGHASAPDDDAADADDPDAHGPDADDDDGDGGKVWVARSGSNTSDAGGAKDAKASREDATRNALIETAELRARFYQRRRTFVAVMSGMFPGFGTAHLWTGAWGRGLALAALESFGIWQASTGHPLGKIAIASAVLLDICGTIWRRTVQSRASARADTGSAIPPARARDA
jgi:putative signal transducing protein